MLGAQRRRTREQALLLAVTINGAQYDPKGFTKHLPKMIPDFELPDEEQIEAGAPKWWGAEVEDEEGSTG